MAMQLGQGRGLKSQINVTPFVDVALVLLIIFMVVTPMLQRGKDVRLPKASSSETAHTDANLVVVSVTADKRIWLNNELHTEKSLVPALTRQFAFLPAPKVLLKGDEALSVRDIRRVIASVQRAGAAGVTLAVQEARRE
ncbi:MAG TPA: biopolymer transporter ExbD [Polyangiaceae bacterium]|nr:biopolymer transporter ExbD [Polyangiaceae bacterium]